MSVLKVIKAAVLLDHQPSYRDSEGRALSRGFDKALERALAKRKLGADAIIDICDFDEPRGDGNWWVCRTVTLDVGAAV